MVSTSQGTERLVISEIRTFPTPVDCTCAFPGQPGTCPATEWVEFRNTGDMAIDTVGWWLCDHPASLYIELVRDPNLPGGPGNPGFLLAPGDFLVIRFDCQLSLFDPPVFSTRLNSANPPTTTHVFSLPFPYGSPFYLATAAGNFSIWDFGGVTPDFNLPEKMRDFLAWSNSGVYSGLKRGCQAAASSLHLWPAALSGNCLTDIPEPQFVSVVSATISFENGLSINYNGGAANDPTDYFLAPATEGEPNRLPGDLNGDFVLDNSDYNAFVGCIGWPSSSLECAGADFQPSPQVDCDDWPVFVALWEQFSVLPVPATPAACIPPPPCVRGDLNLDGQVTWEDHALFVNVLQGMDTDPADICRADTSQDGVIDCNDSIVFNLLVLGSESSCFAPCIRGDANDDGRLDGMDVGSFVNKLLAGGCRTPIEICRLDLNQDLNVNVQDAEGMVISLLTAP